MRYNSESSKGYWQHGENARFEGIIEVCFHRISFWFDIPAGEVDDSIQEALEVEAESRAKSQIVEGYHSGELNCLYCNEEISGWWEIITKPQTRNPKSAPAKSEWLANQPRKSKQ